MSNDKSKASFFEKISEEKDPTLLNKIESGKENVISVDSKGANTERIGDSKVKSSDKVVSKVKRKQNALQININDILSDDFESYKEDFILARNNIRLTEENYTELKKLKATDISMVHLVNYLIKALVSNENYKQYINKNI